MIIRSGGRILSPYVVDSVCKAQMAFGRPCRVLKGFNRRIRTSKHTNTGAHQHRTCRNSRVPGPPAERRGVPEDGRVGGHDRSKQHDHVTLLIMWLPLLILFISPLFLLIVKFFGMSLWSFNLLSSSHQLPVFLSFNGPNKRHHVARGDVSEYARALRHHCFPSLSSVDNANSMRGRSHTEVRDDSSETKVT